MHRALDTGANAAFLLTMLEESGERSRSHGIRHDVLKAQASALGVSLVTRSATWSGYEHAFVAALRELKDKGIQAGVFGDIDIDDHRRWEEKVCETAGIDAQLPLWKCSRLELLKEFLSAGFLAIIVTVEENKLGREFLGRTIDSDLVNELEETGIDPCGENGEYHTLVTDGPIFSRPLQLSEGNTFSCSRWLMLDVRVAGIEDGKNGRGFR